MIQDVALNEELRGGSLVLHDINGEALEDMYECEIRALNVAQADLKLEKAQCLEGGLSGADFVVLSISTGGLDATALELEIPAHYGLVQTVGDTVGQAVSSAACGKSLWLWLSPARWRGIALMPYC